MKLLPQFIHFVSQLFDEHHRLVRELAVIHVFTMPIMHFVHFPLQGLRLLVKVFRHVTTSGLSQEFSGLMQLCNLRIHVKHFIRFMMPLMRVVFPFRFMPKHLMDLGKMLMESPSQILCSTCELTDRLSIVLNRFQNFDGTTAKLSDVMSEFLVLSMCKFVADALKFL